MAVPELGRIEGKYEILQKLQEGGMGAVYKVRHRLLDETRVIKVIRPHLRSDEALRRRFLREARSAVRLRHPNIAQLYDFTVDDDGTAFMVMEFIDGEDLARLTKRRGRMAVRTSLQVGIQTLRALAYLHRHEFVHRDISPDNLMLTQDVDGALLVKLIDLGIAKPLKSELDLTGQGLFLGKIRYASPEQLGRGQGKIEVDTRSDLYSLGVVLFEAVTGHHPVQGTGHEAIVAGHLFHAPRDFADVDPDGRVPMKLRQVLEKALEKDPGGRFPDAGLFSTALEEILGQWTEAEPEIEIAAELPAGDRPGRSRRPTTQEELDRRFAPEPTHPPSPSLEPVPDPTLVREARIEVETLVGRGLLDKAEERLERARVRVGDHAELARLRERIGGIRGEAESLLEEALELRDEGDLKRAAVTVRRAAALWADGAEVGELGAAIEDALRREDSIAKARAVIETALGAGDVAAAEASLKAAVDVHHAQAELWDLDAKVRETLAAETDRRRSLEGVTATIGDLIESGALDEASSALARARESHGPLDEWKGLGGRIEEAVQRRRIEELAAASKKVQDLRTAAAEAADGGDWTAAQATIAEAVELEPRNRELRELQDLYRARQIEDERRIQARAEAADRVRTLSRRQDFEGARRALVAAVERHGTDEELAGLERDLAAAERHNRAEVLGRRARASIDAGELTEARQWLGAARELEPDEPALEELDEELARQQRAREAAAAAATIRQLIGDGRREEAEEALVEAVERCGELDPLLRARRALDSMPPTGDRKRVAELVRKAEVEARRSDFSAAVELLREAHALAPEDPSVASLLRSGEKALAQHGDG